MFPTTPVHDVREAATLAGAESFEIKDGNPRACFRTGWGAARFLLELARKDARREWIRAFALWLRKSGGGSDEGFARALHTYGKSLPFAREEGEIFQGPSVTIKEGGDCDCHARLIYAVAKSGGLPTELAFLHKGENPTHVFVRVYVNGAWRALETTVDAEFGEDPFSAARRLGVVREDIGSPEIITMGESDNGDCPEELEADPEAVVVGDEETIGALPVAPVALLHTRDLTNGFFAKLQAMCGRLGCNPLDMLAVMMRESEVKATAHNSSQTVTESDDAWGLNQIMTFHFTKSPNALGWDPARPAREFTTLSAEDQLPFVERYFRPYTGHLGSIGAIYAVNFLPGRVAQRGSDPGTVLTTKGENFYTSNSGLDVNRDGNITIDDLSQAARGAAHGPRWDEIAARAGGAFTVEPRSVGAVAVLLVGAAGLGALAKYFFA
jgi:hypothetical protein